MNCAQCGTKNPNDFVFCLQCGGRLGAPASQSVLDRGPAAEPVAATIAEPMPAPEPFASPLDVSARLHVEQGSVDRREFVIDKPVMTIGRRLGNDIVIHDTNVSRQHARLMREGDAFVLEDCNSANGTLVNDQRLEGSRRLVDGDVIRIGEAVFVFHCESIAGVVGAGTTLAMDLDSPLTSLGQPISIEPPRELVASPPPSSPLTPPPPIMETTRATMASDAVAEAIEPAPSPPEGPRTPTTPPPYVPPRAQPAGPAAPVANPVQAVREEVQQLKSDLARFAESLGGLADRVEQLDSQLASVSAAYEDVSSSLAPLSDLAPLLDAIRAGGGPERLQPIIELLDQLAAQPRDIELLIKLAQQREAIDQVLRLHLRLMEAAPKVRAALERVVG